MPHFARGDGKGDRSLDERWRQKAKDVKRSVANVDLLSDREKARWDLADAERKPTGKKVPGNWKYGKPLKRQNESEDRDGRPDVRNRPTIRDGDKSE